MKSSKRRNKRVGLPPAVYAYYSDHRAAYALIIPDGVPHKVWRLRVVADKNDAYSPMSTFDYPHSRFRDIGSFIGYCKLKHSDLCTG